MNEREKILRKILTPKARERLGNVRIIKPELVEQLELYLVQLYNSGKLNRLITEKEIVQILSNLGKKRDFRILRR